jgi:hypothetical protein
VLVIISQTITGRAWPELPNQAQMRVYSFNIDHIY